MIEDFENKFDLSIPRRKYYSEDFGLIFCPECGSALIEDRCTVSIWIKSDLDEGEFMSNLTGSHFCDTCPVVVFDSEKIEQAVSLGIREGTNLRYVIKGIINFNAVPKEKREIELGTESNPVPLVNFLPNLIKKTVASEKKTGRNDPCLCGSGYKYKKCCG